MLICVLPLLMHAIGLILLIFHLDSLYRVPILTYGEDEGMSGRVGASALTALGMEELIVHSHQEYFDKAVRLGSDKKYFGKLRGQLVDSCLQRPRSPFWDMRRYVRSLENGFEKIWRTFLAGDQPQTVYALDPLGQPTNSGLANRSTAGGDDKTGGVKSSKDKKGKSKRYKKAKKDKKKKDKKKKDKKKKSKKIKKGKRSGDEL